MPIRIELGKEKRVHLIAKSPSADHAKSWCPSARVNGRELLRHGRNSRLRGKRKKHCITQSCISEPATKGNDVYPQARNKQSPSCDRSGLCTQKPI